MYKFKTNKLLMGYVYSIRLEIVYEYDLTLFI